jgi:hypothetical protein
LSSRKSKQPAEEPPKRNKALLYVAFGMSIMGAIMLVVPTILIFMPQVNLEWSNLFKYPHTYIALGGLILVTAGLILQRRITPPMERKEMDKLRSRLE